MRKVVSNDGTKIAYVKAGDGPPIVLLNGGFRDHSIFASVVPVLAERCTVYVYDRRGRGESGDASEYAVEREIQDLEAVIEEAGGEAVVFGGSSGANLALEAALSGSPITRLALHEPYYKVDGYPPPPDDFMDTLRSLLAEDKRDEAAGYFCAKLVGFTDEEIAGWRRNPLWAANVANAHTLVYDTAICGDFRVPVERLASFGLLTLVINSDNSSGWLREAAKATVAALRNGRGVSLPGEWHRVQPDVLARALAEFTLG